jgi:hypothetical protein
MSGSSSRAVVAARAGPEADRRTEVDELRPRGVLHVVVELEPEQIESMQNGFYAEVRLGSGEVTSEIEMLLPELISDVPDPEA